MRHMKIVLRLATVLILGCALATAQQTPSASEHEQHHPETGQQGANSAPGAKEKMDDMCSMMKKDMDNIHANMEQEHASVESLIKAMNATTGPAKMDVMAATITQMAAHFEKMHQMHEEMMGKMMQHMSGHMMESMGASQKSGMMMCPMMQGHGDSASGNAHAEDEKQPTASSAPNIGDTEEHSAHHSDN